MATVGGWWTPEENFTKDTVWWYSTNLSPANAAWAYDKGSPQRRIAALELFGTLLLLRTMGTSLQDRCLRYSTDNRANAHGLLRCYSKKAPLATIQLAIVMELQRNNAHLATGHVLRDENKWADQLTRGDYGGFCSAHRLTPNVDFQDINDLARLWDGHRRT